MYRWLRMVLLLLAAFSSGNVSHSIPLHTKHSNYIRGVLVSPASALGAMYFVL